MQQPKSKTRIRLKHLLKLRYHRALQRSYRLEKFNKYNMIFIHIPKAAGTAVNQGLFGRLAGLGHVSCQKYLQIYGSAAFYSMFKFTFTRNPYDRFVSAYEYLKNGGNNSHDLLFKQEVIDQYEDFNDFVLNGFALRADIQNRIHFRKQVDFLLIGNRIAVDFLGRHENIQKDYQYIASMIHDAHELENINSSRRNTSFDEYFMNNRVRDIIRNCYEPDFRLLKYRT